MGLDLVMVNTNLLAHIGITMAEINNSVDGKFGYGRELLPKWSGTEKASPNMGNFLCLFNRSSKTPWVASGCVCWA